MKRVGYAALIAAAVSLPSLSFADGTNAPVTRAQVRAELVAAEQAGQYPHVYASYPDKVSNPSLNYVMAKSAAKAAESSYGSAGTASSVSLAASNQHN